MGAVAAVVVVDEKVEEVVEEGPASDCWRCIDD